ncbi:MAG: hypothetical protein ACTSRA_05595 [Promethearchaeota archaeon]
MGDDPFANLDAMMEPVDKDANKAKMVEKLEESFNNGTPFISYCDNYVYVIYPKDPDGNTWMEYSFMRETGEIEKNERDKEMAFLVIKEEVARGLPELLPDLNVKPVLEITEKHVNDPQGLILELIANVDPRVPVVRSKDELNKAIDLVKSA